LAGEESKITFTMVGQTCSLHNFQRNVKKNQLKGGKDSSAKPLVGTEKEREETIVLFQKDSIPLSSHHAEEGKEEERNVLSGPERTCDDRRQAPKKRGEDLPRLRDEGDSLLIPLPKGERREKKLSIKERRWDQHFKNQETPARVLTAFYHEKGKRGSPRRIGEPRISREREPCAHKGIF